MVEFYKTMQAGNYWIFHVVLTEDKVGGQTDGFRIRPALGTLLTIDYIYGGQDNMAGDRSINAYLRDLKEGGFDIFKHIFSLGTIDNDWYAIIDRGFQGVTTAGVTQIENPKIPHAFDMWIGYDKEIDIVVTSLAQNETVTIRGAGWVIGDAVPTFASWAASDNTITTDHNIFYGGVGT